MCICIFVYLCVFMCVCVFIYPVLTHTYIHTDFANEKLQESRKGNILKYARYTYT